MKTPIVLLLAAFSLSSHAAVITSPADPLLAGATVITFDELPLGSLNPTISGVSFTGDGRATEIVSSIGLPAPPDLNNNGVDVDIVFGSPVLAFGMDLFLADRDVTVEAFDADGNLVGTAILLSPPGTIASGFRGVGGVGPIASARVDVAPEFIRIDSFHFVTAAVPTPATLMLLVLGLVQGPGLPVRLANFHT